MTQQSLLESLDHNKTRVKDKHVLNCVYSFRLHGRVPYIRIKFSTIV